MRAIIVRLLRERADATPSDIVELLGEYVIWGPPDPPADERPGPVARPCPSRRSSPPEPGPTDTRRSSRVGSLHARPAHRGHRR